MGNVKIGVNLGTPDAASAQMETGQAWSFRTGGGGGVLYAGHGSPSLSVGGVGDFYLDLDAGTLYGPKIEGDWGSPIPLGGGPGSVAFTDLTDVPASYTGEGSKIVSVKATEDGLEFTTAPVGSFTPGDLTDAGTDGITITGGTSAVNGSGTAISQHVADTTHNGYLSSTDWNTFNGKQSALTTGDLTDAGTDGIAITGGTGSVIGTGTSIAQDKADATHNGYLDKDDWSAFNSKSNVETFTDLSDTPANYTGQAGLSAVVKGTEDGLEFARKIGPAVALTTTTDGDFALWDGTDGLHIRDDGLALDTDGTLAADSDVKIPSQKAVKTYVDAHAGGGAPDSAHYVTTQAEAGLSAEFNLGGLTTGLLKHTVAAGVSTPATASEGTDYLAGSRIDDTAYDATTWNGVTDYAPSKNAVRDKFESLVLGASRIVTTLSDATSITPQTDGDSNINIQNNTQSTGTLTVNAPSATAEARGLVLRVKCTNAQTLSFNSIYRAPSLLPLPTGISAGKTAYVAFAYNDTDSKWDLTAVMKEY